jgi:hypothetical protein
MGGLPVVICFVLGSSGLRPRKNAEFNLAVPVAEKKEGDQQ